MAEGDPLLGEVVVEHFPLSVVVVEDYQSDLDQEVAEQYPLGVVEQEHQSGSDQAAVACLKARYLTLAARGFHPTSEAEAQVHYSLLGAEGLGFDFPLEVR